MTRWEQMSPADFFGNATSIEHHAKPSLRARNRQDNPLACQFSVKLLQRVRPGDIENRNRLCIKEKPSGPCVCVLDNGPHTVFEVIFVEEKGPRFKPVDT